MKTRPTRKHSYPPEVVLVAHCVHPKYRADYGRYRDSTLKKNDQMVDKLRQKYPRISGHTFPNPDMIDWVRIARNKGTLLPEDEWILNSPSSVLPSEQPVRLIPAWFPVSHAGNTPSQGYKKYSQETLCEGRWLHVEIDVLAPTDSVLEQIKIDLKIFKETLQENEKKSRNRRNALIKNLALFHTYNVARSKKMAPHGLLDPDKFSRKTRTNLKRWKNLTAEFSRARSRANAIFREIGLVEYQ